MTADDRACEECGSTAQVGHFYGRETCDADDPWWGCWECRWRYIRHRLYGPDARGPPGDVHVPEPEPDDRTPTESGHSDPMEW